MEDDAMVAKALAGIRKSGSVADSIIRAFVAAAAGAMAALCGGGKTMAFSIEGF
jgi:hypothetical protein